MNVCHGASLSTGTSVKLQGQFQKSKGSGQAYELVVDQLEVLGSCGSVSGALSNSKKAGTQIAPVHSVLSHPEETPSPRCASGPCAFAI